MGTTLALRRASAIRSADAPFASTALALVLTVGACTPEPNRRASADTSSVGRPSTEVQQPGTYRMSVKGLARIRENEAFIPKVYDDGVGNKTIGYGHMLRPGETFPGTITESEARALFEKDVARIVAPALGRIKVPLTQDQVDALGSFIYNVGPGNFQRSVLSEVNDKDHKGVIAEMGEYTKGRNQRTGERVTLRGLVRRRREEIALYEGRRGGVSIQERPRAAERLLATGLLLLRMESSCFVDAFDWSRFSS